MSQQNDSKDDRAARLPKTKAAIRRELEQAMQQFLHSGGEVNNVPVGVSAWEPGTRPPPARPLFAEPPADRTPVPEVVATIEARREALKQERKPAAQRRSRRPRKKLIYDDFGEPLRHVWVDD
jgi:hypothetical protein